MNVHWHEGLFLQPQHLQLMQRRLQLEMRAARALLCPQFYGVVEGKLSYDDLADGRIRFERLHVILPSGQEVRFPRKPICRAWMCGRRWRAGRARWRCRWPCRCG